MKQKGHNPRKGHVKHRGVVEESYRPKWTARLWIDGGEYLAEMTDPLPGDRKVGSPFTIHTTRKGKTYLYWIDYPPFSKRQIKQADQWVRAIRVKLGLS